MDCADGRVNQRDGDDEVQSRTQRGKKTRIQQAPDQTGQAKPQSENREEGRATHASCAGRRGGVCTPLNDPSAETFSGFGEGPLGKCQGRRREPMGLCGYLPLGMPPAGTAPHKQARHS